MSSTISVERDKTDESLRAERQKTDEALVDKQAAVDERADQTLEDARSAADAVMATARGAADTLSTDGLAPAALAEQRAADDEALESARTDADEALRRQRAEDVRVLAELLPLERQNTDRYLLTERTRADDAVAHRDDFLGIVSHDLRDLLSGIVLSAALLPDSVSDKHGTKQRIQRYAARMNRLIGDLVDVAAIDAGRLSVVPTTGDWSALVEEVTGLFQPSAAAQGVVLEIGLSERPMTLRFDHDRMLQVLANLIANSLKFTQHGGTIRVAAERRADELHCVVQDTGSGIPSNMLEAIFQRFWQVRADDRRGVGLGLYITRCIVEAHHGRIWAESTEGVGSALRFSLPLISRVSL